LDPPDFYQNANGLADARSFLDYLITKAKVEFMPDRDTPNTFHNVLLEGTEYDKDGTAYKLKNITRDVYTTGLLKFRGVIG
jgi:hypothetical protein